jgi:hypothetical protein
LPEAPPWFLVNVPAALVGAAFALIAAMIGGATTLLAGRSQWRRESRREAYAQLLTASHEVRWWLEGSPPDAKSHESGEAIRKFFAALDAASVIASYPVQINLDTWRVVADDLPELCQSTNFMENEAAKRDVLRQWIEEQRDFHTAAKHELGVRGLVSYRRRAHTYALIAAFSLLISVVFLYLDYAANIANQIMVAGIVYYWIGLLALVLAGLSAIKADIASGNRQKPLAILGIGFVGLFLAFLLPVFFAGAFEPWIAWIHVPGVIVLILGLFAYWIAKQVELVKYLLRWRKDKEHRGKLKQQPTE